MKLKFKHVLIVFSIGILLTISGAFFKILHWAFAVELMTLAYFFLAAAAVLLIVKLITFKNDGSILNR